MMRVYFLTLRADNLPETGKRQYENKADLRASRRNGVDRRHKRKAFAPSFFPPNEMQSDAVQHRQTT
jgi:hypothetical protein